MARRLVRGSKKASRHLSKDMKADETLATIVGKEIISPYAAFKAIQKAFKDDGEAKAACVKAGLEKFSPKAAREFVDAHLTAEASRSEVLAAKKAAK